MLAALAPFSITMLVVFLILVAGLVGGWAAHLAISAPVPAKPGDPPQPPPPSLLADIVIGVTAAFCVPVFLTLTQSKILTEALTAPKPNENFFYLVSFCLIAAFSSRAFLQRISAQVLQKVEQKQSALEVQQQKLGETQQKIADVALDATNRVCPGEKPRLLAAVAPTDASKEAADALADHEKDVIRALANNQYTRRSLTGLVDETNLSKPLVVTVLPRLKQLGFTAERTSHLGTSLYELTREGEAVAAALKD